MKNYTSPTIEVIGVITEDIITKSLSLDVPSDWFDDSTSDIG